MCCPLTLATVAWFFTMFTPILADAGDRLLVVEGSSPPAVSEYNTHNNSVYEPAFPPFVISPIPNQEITTTSPTLVIPLYEVFSSDENSRLSFEIFIFNGFVADGDISSDTLYVTPERPGTTRIRITAEDDEGRNATDTFRLDVRENNAPQVALEVPVGNQAIIEGSDPLTLNLSTIFFDPDGDPLDYEVSSTNEEVSVPSIEQGILIAPADTPGTTILQITALDPFGSENTITFELEVIRAYPSQFQTGFSMEFGAITVSSSYRLIALPGNLTADLAETTPGSSSDDWIAFAPDTSADEGLVPYLESAPLELRPGSGLWFLSKETWDIPAQRVSSVPLSNAGTYTISLHSGWNIISNPFDVDLEWKEVSAWNDISQTLWAFDGSYTASESFETTAQQGRAYYFFNAEERESLQLPYPGLANPFLSKKSTHATIEALSLTVENEFSLTSKVLLGRSVDGRQGVDPLDLYAPPGHFSAVDLRTAHSHAEGKPVYLARDIQASQSGVHRYDLLLTSVNQNPVRVLANNLDDFDSEAVTLVNLLDATTYDLHSRNSFWFAPEQETTPFALLLGPAREVTEAIKNIDPELYTLKQNYPNPVQSSTTIEFSIPDPQHITLSIYDAMGRLVKVLVNRSVESGLHRVEWHGDNQNQLQLANGIYFYQLRTGGTTLHKKMVLLR